MLLTVILAGCIFPIGPPEQVDFTGDLQASDDGFRMDGEIVNGSPGDPPRFTDVAVYLYAANGTLLHTEPVGALVRRTNVSIRTDFTPEYVIISAPEFWTTDTDVAYFELVDESEGYSDRLYAERTITVRDELPVDLPEE